jgi:hypothetical protein
VDAQGRITTAGSVAVPTAPVTSVNGQTGAVNLLTTNVAEGTNLYYTQARFDTAFGAKTTDNLAEGATNLYYTDTRARNAISVAGLPLTYNAGTGVVGINQASGSQAGYISAADFTTFTNKQNAITAQNVTAASSKITLGGTPTGATLQPFSVDVNEANLSLQNIGGALSTTQQNAINLGILAGTINLGTQTSGVLPIFKGGTGLSTAPPNGQILIGNGATYVLGNLVGTNSITGNGTSTPFSLIGDITSPGNSYYYGTDGTGVKGFYNLGTSILANNGLTNNAGTLQFGGTLVQDTTIDGSGTYNLDIINNVRLSLSAQQAQLGGVGNTFFIGKTGEIAVGDGNTFNANNQITIGDNNILNNESEYVIGHDNNIVGSQIFTTGLNNNLSSLQAGSNQLFVTGFDNTPSSNIDVTNSFVLGGANQFAGSSDTTENYIIGFKNNLQSQNNAWIFGRDNVVKDAPSTYNYIFGNNNLSYRNNNFSIGQNLNTTSDNIIDLGFSDGTKTSIDNIGRLTLRGSFSPNGNDGAGGQVLTSQGAGAVPTWSDAGSLLTAGTGIGISGNTINNTGVLLTGTQTIAGQKIFQETTGTQFRQSASNDTIQILGNNSATPFTGSLTTADLTTAQTWTLPNATGTICISGATCVASSTPISSLTSATANNSINNGNFAQTWNWGLTGSTNGLNITENSASTGTGYLQSISTLSGSTAKPFTLTAQGNTILDTSANGSLTLGSTTGAIGITEKVGTGNYILDGVGASNYNIGASTTSGTIDIGGTAQTGTINIANSTGTNTTNISNGSGLSNINISNNNPGSVNIGSVGTNKTITIGNTVGNNTLNLAAGLTNGINLDGKVTIKSAKSLIFNNSANTFSTSLKAGANIANVIFTLPIADGTSGQVIATNGAGALSFATALTASNTYAQGGNSFAAQAELGTNDANILSLRTNNVSRFQLQFASATLQGQGATTLSSTSTLDLNSLATSALRVGSNLTTGTLAIGGTAGTGNIDIGQSSAAQTINIGNLGAGTKTIGIGNGATVNTITVGNTTAGTAVNLRAGTGKITAISSTLGVELVNNAVSWSSISDRTTKENLVEVDNALAKIKTLTGYNYNYKAEFGDSLSKHNGLIAQEVQAVLPDAVGELSNGKLGIQYDQITALTVNAIKELSVKVDALDPAQLASGKNGLAFVNKQMEQAFDRIAKLENRVELVETKNLDQDAVIKTQQAVIDALLKRVEDLEKVK